MRTPHRPSATVRSFCQKMPSPATSKPIMSFTAIIGALTAALPVTIDPHLGAALASASRLASLTASPRRWPRCSGSHDGQHLPGLPGDVGGEEELGAGDEPARGEVLRHRDQESGAAGGAQARRSRRTRSASQISSSWPSSPCGSSVDMHRKSAHWSSMYSAGHGASKVRTR